MKCFESMAEVANANLAKTIERAVSRSVQNMLTVYGNHYDPAEDGRVVLFDETTTDDHARQLFGQTWANAPLEGVTYDRETRTFLVVILLNNQLAHSIIVPDMPWIFPAFRANLMEHLCGEGPL